MSSAGARTSPSSSLRALSPAKVVKRRAAAPARPRACRVTVPDHQLSPGHRQQGPERPPVCPPDRLQHRHPPRIRLLRRGAAHGVKAEPPSGYAIWFGKEVGYLQQQKQKKIPVRRCVGCNAQAPQDVNWCAWCVVLKAEIQHGPARQSAGPRRLRVPLGGLPCQSAQGQAASNARCEVPIPDGIYDRHDRGDRSVRNEAQRRRQTHGE